MCVRRALCILFLPLINLPWRTNAENCVKTCNYVYVSSASWRDLPQVSFILIAQLLVSFYSLLSLAVPFFPLNSQRSSFSSETEKRNSVFSPFIFVFFLCMQLCAFTKCEDLLFKFDCEMGKKRARKTKKTLALKLYFKAFLHFAWFNYISMRSILNGKLSRF